MSRAEAKRWLHGMLHGLACLPCADATAPVAQLCYPATMLQPNPTAIALSGIISSFDSFSPHLIRGHNKLGKRLRAADYMMGWDQGVCIAPWRRSMLLASVFHAGMADTRKWPREDRFYRPPAATPRPRLWVSRPMSTFSHHGGQPPRCMRASRVQLAAQAAVHCPGRPQSDDNSPDTWWARLGLHSSRSCNHPPINHHSRVSLTKMQLHEASDCMRASRVQLAAQAAVHCPGRPQSNDDSLDT